METTLGTRTQRFYVAGEPVEYWEDPDVTFDCTPEQLRGYAQQGSWVLLFNALAMMSSPVQAE